MKMYYICVVAAGAFLAAFIAFVALATKAAGKW
jgi:hypothetical protein